jgi:hypothetical protein
MDRRKFLRSNYAAGLTIGLVPLAVWNTKHEGEKADKNARQDTPVKTLAVVNGETVKREKYLIVFDDSHKVLHISNWVEGNAIASAHNFIVDTKERLMVKFPDADFDLV